MVALWALLVVVSGMLIVWKRLWTRLAVLGLHLSFIVILVGAAITHFTSVNGVMHLREGETSNMLILSDNSIRNLDFNLRLDKFNVHYYPGTDTPSDYSSKLTVLPREGQPLKVAVSMNKVFDFKGYRFYQSAYDEDMGGTVLAACDDFWGMSVTYCGYGLLLLSIIGFFFTRNSQWRVALRQLAQTRKKVSKTVAVLLLMLVMAPFGVRAELKSVSPEVANEMGNVMVLYQGRVCPLNTLARDFALKLYKSDSYKGYSDEQVLCGWMFFPQQWSEDIHLDKTNPKDQQKALLLESVCTGGLLRMFPLVQGNSVLWVSSIDRLPEDLPVEERQFIRKVHSYLQELVMTNNNAQAIVVIEKLQRYQQKNAAHVLPSESQVKIERFYNSIIFTKPVAMASLSAGLLLLIAVLLFLLRDRREPLWLNITQCTVAGALLLYLSVLIALRWVVMQSIPLTNGYEAMECMAWLAVIVALLFRHKFVLLLPTGLLIAGFALLVALMGENDPPITPVMPVLSSPLLSVHVMLVMLAYALLAIIFLLSICALVLRAMYKHSPQKFAAGADVLQRVGLIIQVVLTPAVFLLALGIFVGAVWANVSWGSYWQWDPKETWALITMLVYAVPLHRDFMKRYDGVAMQVYLVVAFVCVLITYFGVNYFLGGMHSYA